MPYSACTSKQVSERCSFHVGAAGPGPGQPGDSFLLRLRVSLFAGVDGAHWPLTTADGCTDSDDDDAGSLYVSRRICIGGAATRPRCSPASAPTLPAAAEAAEAAAAHSAAACWRGSSSAVRSAASPPARLSSGPDAGSGSLAAVAGGLTAGESSRSSVPGHRIVGSA